MQVSGVQVRRRPDGAQAWACSAFLLRARDRRRQPKCWHHFLSMGAAGAAASMQDTRRATCHGNTTACQAELAAEWRPAVRYARACATPARRLRAVMDLCARRCTLHVDAACRMCQRLACAGACLRMHVRMSLQCMRVCMQEWWCALCGGSASMSRCWCRFSAHKARPVTSSRQLARHDRPLAGSYAAFSAVPLSLSCAQTRPAANSTQPKQLATAAATQHFIQHFCTPNRAPDTPATSVVQPQRRGVAAGSHIGRVAADPATPAPSAAASSIQPVIGAWHRRLHSLGSSSNNARPSRQQQRGRLSSSGVHRRHAPAVPLARCC